jgi:hypothetical protein
VICRDLEVDASRERVVDITDSVARFCRESVRLSLLQG